MPRYPPLIPTTPRPDTSELSSPSDLLFHLLNVKYPLGQMSVSAEIVWFKSGIMTHRGGHDGAAALPATSAKKHKIQYPAC